MKIKVQLVIEDEESQTTIVEEIGCLQRDDPRPETLGLTLAEGKQLLAILQKAMVAQQMAEFIKAQPHCPACGQPHRRNGRHQITYRTLFGRLSLPSPRFYTCDCQRPSQKSFSPVADLLPERTAPELKYLQAKWASLMSYGLTVDLLEEVLPLKTNVATVLSQVRNVADKLESELGDEENVFMEDPERKWKNLPRPTEPLVVGIDGGFVHAREGDNHKAGWFEVIVGKSMQENHPSKRFASVQTYDDKPKRRLYTMLRSQGLAMNQAITFLSDGGDDVRDLQLYLSPEAEHILDWFYVTMRLTVMRQLARSLPPEETWLEVDKQLERIKWYLWHGNVSQALTILDEVKFEFECYADGDEELVRLGELIAEFETYIAHNRAYMPNYSDRYHYGEPISSAFVESTVNEVVSRRMVKKQQMRWTKEGAHRLLQVRTKTLDDDLRGKFITWYPGMAVSDNLNVPIPRASRQQLSC